MPQMLNYAELRIQRDLDLLPLQTDNSSYSLTAGNNVLSLSVNDFVTVQNIAVLSGTQRTTLTPVTKEYLQAVFDDSTFVATLSISRPMAVMRQPVAIRRSASLLAPRQIRVTNC